MKPKIKFEIVIGNMNLLAEAFAQGKLVCKEMVLTKDVTIARNQMMPDGTGETSPTVLPSGTRVKLIKTPKGIYMQTPEGKILRIHSAAPATPASPSTIAAALGLNLKTSFPGVGAHDSSTGLASFSGGSKSSLMEQSMLKRIRGNAFLKHSYLLLFFILFFFIIFL